MYGRRLFKKTQGLHSGAWFREIEKSGGFRLWRIQSSSCSKAIVVGWIRLTVRSGPNRFRSGVSRFTDSVIKNWYPNRCGSDSDYGPHTN